MSEIRQESMRAAVLKALMDEVKKVYDAARAEADGRLIELNRAIGVKTIEVRLPGYDQPVAQVTLSEPKTGYVVDEAGFLAWCKQEHPSEVQVTTPAPVESVRPAWRKALLGRMKVEPDGTVVDGETGRVLDFVEVAEPPPPSTTLTFKKGGREEVARAYRDGRLALPDLLALPASPQE
ncbi:hypothetical protein GA0070610_1784 [Micromonospora echinofusca]|uniref:Uncharacterized protein n=1 Tax=Micromonospora echinofusca TaxID=47858 RepID=A0A1C5G740_MICEH|nr:hypothetical protein [Micromonospora echinofusca]SCG15550.1 hypothetical protein GA0070610_1784 [Micromonospora echinofusca]